MDYHVFIVSRIRELVRPRSVDTRRGRAGDPHDRRHGDERRARDGGGVLDLRDDPDDRHQAARRRARGGRAPRRDRDPRRAAARGDEACSASATGICRDGWPGCRGSTSRDGTQPPSGWTRVERDAHLQATHRASHVPRARLPRRRDPARRRSGSGSCSPAGSRRRVLAVTPLLVPVLIGFRGLTWAGARLEAALAGSLLGVEVQPPPLRAGAAGYWGRIRGILGEAAFWRQQVYLVLRMVLGFADGDRRRRRARRVARAASRCRSRTASSHPNFGSWHVDTLPRALLFVPAGLVGLASCSAWLVARVRGDRGRGSPRRFWAGTARGRARRRTPASVLRSRASVRTPRSSRASTCSRSSIWAADDARVLLARVDAAAARPRARHPRLGRRRARPRPRATRPRPSTSAVSVGALRCSSSPSGR